VIGPVLGALTLGLGYWVYRLRRAKPQEHQSGAAVGATNNNDGGGYNPTPVAPIPEQALTRDPLYVKPEMFAGEPPVELPTSHGYYG
jgi:hypothetical protein